MEKVRFYVNLDICRHAILYILNQMGNKCDLHKLFKILYFAEQKHLATYGIPITGDHYIAMKNGPVPSTIYDFLKQLKNGKQNDEDFKIIEYPNLETAANANLKKLSKSRINFLNASIAENKSLSFSELSEKSHGLAWEKADENNEIDFLLIAEEVGANEAMRELIALNSENIVFINELEKKHSNGNP